MQAPSNLKLALVIPTWNNAATIEETMYSIYLQNSLELVQHIYVADDGSIDDTIARIQSEQVTQKTRLSILSNCPNVGQWTNLNRILKTIRENGYDWVLILHSDDIAKSNWLEVMCKQIQICSPKVASICASWDNLMPDLTVIQGEDDLGRKPEEIVGTPSSTRDTLLRGCWWHISGAAIRLSAFESIGDFDLKYSYMGDYEWLLRTLSTGWSIIYIPRTLITYRQHDSSVSSASHYFDLDLRQGMALRQKYLQYLSKRDTLKLNMRSAGTALRRIGRAVSKADLKKMLVSLATLLYIIGRPFQTNR